MAEDVEAEEPTEVLEVTHHRLDRHHLPNLTHQVQPLELGELTMSNS